VLKEFFGQILRQIFGQSTVANFEKAIQPEDGE
jgi:hypothetical protein